MVPVDMKDFEIELVYIFIPVYPNIWVSALVPQVLHP